MSKKCIYCGNELDDDAAFCGECGKKQEPSSHQETTNEERQETDTRDTVENPISAQAEVAKDDKSKKSKPFILFQWWVIIGVLLCTAWFEQIWMLGIAIVLICGRWVINHKKSECKVRGIKKYILGIVVALLVIGCIGIVFGEDTTEPSGDNPQSNESTSDTTNDSANNNTENSEVGNKTHTIRLGYTIEAGTAFSDGVAFVALQKDNVYSIVAIDKEGKILYTLKDNIDGEYYSVSLSDIEGYSNGVLVIGNNLYDKKGNIIASPSKNGYDEIYISNSLGFANIDGYIIVRKYEESIEGEKYLVGVINNTGNWEIPLSEQGVFTHGNCQISWTNDIEDTFWYGKENFIISEKWIEYKYVSDSWAENGIGIYKSNFSGEDEIVLKNFYCHGSYHSGYLMNDQFFIGGELILRQDEYGDTEYVEGDLGLYDYSGKKLLDLSKYNVLYTHGVYYENNNLLFLAYNGASSNYVCFLNENGETIIEPIKCDSDDEDDCYYPLDDKGFVFEKAGDSYNRIFYFCDHNGNITEYGDLTAFGGFSEGLALIIDEHGNMGYINHAGKVIIK